ncbi:MAG: hypothetical protein ICV72_14380 [Aldersonia sp.]|nr:hypothetical protein [Aldersonia sp.]
MSNDFERALARVQNDYEFYVECQTNPAEALAAYDLTPEERSALTDPEKLAERLARGVRITISGTHDWVNRAAPGKRTRDEAGRDAKIAAEVEAIRQAGTDAERTAAAVRLMELVD